MKRVLPILALCALSLSACLDPKAKAEMKAREKARAIAYEQAQQRYQDDVDYLYRVRVVRVCSSNATYIVEGADGRRWVSQGPNPGANWMAMRDTTGHRNPWVTVDPVSPAIPLKDLCL